MLVFIAINCLLMIWRPDGLWRYEVNGKMYYLLGGNYNNMGKALVMALVTNILLLLSLPRTQTYQRRIYTLTFIALIPLSIYTIITVGSTTSTIGVLLILGFGSLLLIPGRALRVLSLTLFVAVYFALQTWAVFSETQAAAAKTEYFIERVLHKDMTFTLRTNIWTRTKDLIERRPLVGHGEHDDRWYEEELAGLTTHNLILHILLKGGWIALSAFILLLIITHLALLQIPSPGIRYTLLFGLWVMLFMMIFEVYTIASWAPLFIYAAYLRPPLSDR